MEDISYKKYLEAVNFIESININPNKNSLSRSVFPDIFVKRTRYLLDLVGSPDKDLKIVHIAGTSGKGSVSDLVQQQIVKNNIKAGVFTSPYAITSIEKIKTNGLYINPKKFTQLINNLKPYIKLMENNCPHGIPSYFEVFLAIALLYFKNEKCTWAIIETGIGGEHDSTNAIEDPKVTVVTNIGLDHTEILGKTRSKIARDKSGIAKKNAIFITSEKRPYLLKIIKDIAIKKGVSKFVTTKHFDDYVIQNKILASAILREIGLNTFDNIEVSLPGRFEKVNSNPLIILDGAHNDDKISSALNRLKQYKYKKLLIVFAVSANKDMSKTIVKMVNVSDKIFITKFNNQHRKAVSPKELRDKILEINSNIACVTFNNSIDAVKAAISEADNNDLILVLGSFFLIGEVRKLWYPEKFILDNRKSF